MINDEYTLTFWQEKCTGRIIQSLYREEYSRDWRYKKKKKVIHTSIEARVKFRYVYQHGVMTELYKENECDPWEYEWDEEEERIKKEEKKNHWLSEELFLANYKPYGKHLKKLDFFEQI